MSFLPFKKLVILCMGVVWQFSWVQVVLVNVTWCNCLLFWLCVFSIPWGFEAQWGLNTPRCGVVWKERKIQVVLGTTPMRKEPCEKKNTQERPKERAFTSVTCLPPPPPPHFPFFSFLSIILSFIFERIKSSCRWQQQ